MGLLVALVSAGLAEPESAKQQLNSTAKNTAKFDGGQGSTSNTSVSTKTTAPTVNVSSQTATATSQRAEKAISDYKKSGPEKPVTNQHIDRINVPAPVQTKKDDKTKATGTVPTGK